MKTDIHQDLIVRAKFSTNLSQVSKEIFFLAIFSSFDPCHWQLFGTSVMPAAGAVDVLAAICLRDLCLHTITSQERNLFLIKVVPGISGDDRMKNKENECCEAVVGFLG
ncbi:hypothetical protein AVEN_97745-1 [Araneus ventricosus]|uniref:Uncharacterized protein n=1 Tax=Araneus ventricosus TaxID=182803 RepID=A0A4Y2E641_ARAVE|nr:hypothetical protein AVEN_97745-1 [Araneus ventricosus]